MTFTVVAIAGTYFLIQDIRLNGLAAATEHLAVSTALLTGIQVFGRVSTEYVSRPTCAMSRVRRPASARAAS